jgi:7,8-dihydroneopterin aldolase/epimerase/oxygenase
MMDRVILRGLHLDLRLGAGEAERARPQRVELDIEMACDLRRAGETDELARTIDYAQVVEAVRGALEGREHKLLEAVAERAAAAAGRFGADDVVVRARKFGPPVNGELAVAEVEVHRRPR